MQRIPIPQKPGEPYAACDFLMESAQEAQQWDKFLPPTEDLPETHEQFIENRVETVNGAPLTYKRVSVREKNGAAKPVITSDGLEQMDDNELEVEASKRGVVNYPPKNASKAKRIKAIREHQPAGV